MPPKKTHRPHRPIHTPESLVRRGVWLLAGAALALLLTACGPGTGGTGTGPVAGVTIPVGTTVRFAAAGPSFSTSPSSCVGGACTLQTISLEAERIELRAGCLRYVRTGAWNIDESHLAVTRGQVETSTLAGVTRTDATLRLQFDGPWDTARTLTVTLTDDAGRVLVAPTPLSRTDALPEPAPGLCGG